MSNIRQKVCKKQIRQNIRQKKLESLKIGRPLSKRAK